MYTKPSKSFQNCCVSHQDEIFSSEELHSITSTIFQDVIIETGKKSLLQEVL